MGVMKPPLPFMAKKYKMMFPIKTSITPWLGHRNFPATFSMFSGGAGFPPGQSDDSWSATPCLPSGNLHEEGGHGIERWISHHFTSCHHQLAGNVW